MTEKKTWNFGERANYAVMWQIVKSKAVLQIVHGMVEHIERYDEFARFANNAGYLVVGHDHVGHGETVKRSRGLRGFAPKLARSDHRRAYFAKGS